MKKELQNKLYKKYPKIFRQKDLSMKETCMCWGISCGDGWYTILDTLCASIQNHVDRTIRVAEGKEERPLQVEAVQVKEKYGGLRFYTNYSDEYVEGMITMAENLALKTCEECGTTEGVTTKGAGPKGEGWISTLCPKCRK